MFSGLHIQAQIQIHVIHICRAIFIMTSLYSKLLYSMNNESKLPCGVSLVMEVFREPKSIEYQCQNHIRMQRSHSGLLCHLQTDYFVFYPKLTSKEGCKEQMLHRNT